MATFQSDSGFSSGSGSFSSSSATELFSSDFDSDSDALQGHGLDDEFVLDPFDSPVMMEREIEREIQRQFMLQETLQIDSSLGKYILVMRDLTHLSQEKAARTQRNYVHTNDESSHNDSDCSLAGSDRKTSGTAMRRRKKVPKPPHDTSNTHPERERAKKRRRKEKDRMGATQGFFSHAFRCVRTLSLLCLFLVVLQSYIHQWFGTPEEFRANQEKQSGRHLWDRHHRPHERLDGKGGTGSKQGGDPDKGVPVGPSVSSLTRKEKERLMKMREMRRNSFLDKLDSDGAIDPSIMYNHQPEKKKKKRKRKKKRERGRKVNAKASHSADNHQTDGQFKPY